MSTLNKEKGWVNLTNLFLNFTEIYSSFSGGMQPCTFGSLL
jgi:hypothetical protein